ncbi:coniferyl aldehyde dehydrogenase [Chiayiivirga flava]|uniref:Aldehyde dehydrogenase n=1 Tax=Chiayiivirga flava TaxID=659595 RepID=A0A7W8D7E8_9GAMM|nr:coniferyl aldehyde dehydrogenase [Chiayiivirga flava]MBB5208066.1 coniferyl-aldehyde dehydrogenase [Chiayiivirga flava]
MTDTTPIADLAPTLARLRAAQAARVPDYAQRIDDLERLRSAFKARLDAMNAAVSADFGHRSRHETLVSDGMTVLGEIDHLRRHLKRWMKPQRRRVDMLFLPARAQVRVQPLGVVGVISPWNYPVNLALMPLAVAIAAGNHVYLKPSEHTPRTSEFLRTLLADVFPAERVAVALGDGDVAAAFSALPFDHLFFTGSTAVGRKVLAAAAPNLTPVTLELGGKSPAIVADGYPLDRAAARIASGKWLNAGQTCIAPDYVYVPRAQRDAFVAALAQEVRARYPTLDDNPDYTRIVNRAQFERLRGYLDDARAHGLTVMPLVAVDDARAAERRVLPPTLVLEPGDDARVMQDEIFGPILPILSYDELDAVLAAVNRRDRPLALYHFDHDRERTRRVLDGTVVGGAAINDTVLQFAQADLPFGGVGPSGMGHYHGREGFLTFSKQTSVFWQARFTGMALFKPPYRGLADRLVKFLTR